jgi:DNA-binding LacI/PurR family transcriptional regulator
MRPSVCTINTDNCLGMRELLDHLYQHGHRRFGFVDGGWLGDIRERREAFEEYIQERGLPNSPGWIQEEENSPEGGYDAMQRLLTLPEHPTAICAADDVMAMGVMKAAIDAGLRIPQDVSLAGFDNIEFAKYLSPALTTMRQPVEAMARQAIELMLQLIKEPEKPLSQVVFRLPPELIIRQSTGPVP